KRFTFNIITSHWRRFTRRSPTTTNTRPNSTLRWPASPSAQKPGPRPQKILRGGSIMGQYARVLGNGALPCAGGFACTSIETQIYALEERFGELSRRRYLPFATREVFCDESEPFSSDLRLASLIVRNGDGSRANAKSGYTGGGAHKFLTESAFCKGLHHR